MCRPAQSSKQLPHGALLPITIITVRTVPVQSSQQCPHGALLAITVIIVEVQPAQSNQHFLHILANSAPTHFS